MSEYTTSNPSEYTCKLENEAILDCTVKLEDEIAVTPTIVANVKEEPLELESHQESFSTAFSDDIKPYEMVCVITNTKTEQLVPDNITYCENCLREYNPFCLECLPLLHILDNYIWEYVDDPARETIPKDILEITVNENRSEGVFAMISLPKGVHFGPFEGLDMIEKSTGYMMWRVKGGQFVHEAKSSNWMEFVNCAENFETANLSIFQYDGKLYYRTEKQINVGEELLMYLEEHGVALNKTIERYFVPTVQDEMKFIYACTFCCLGFYSADQLLRHKGNCPYPVSSHCGGEGIMQCEICKIYMDGGEYIQFHMAFCQQKQSGNVNSTVDGLGTTENELIYGKYRCPNCTYRTYTLHRLKKHENTHKKQFQCKVCGKRFSSDSYRERHMLVHNDPKDTNNRLKNEMDIFRCIHCTKKFGTLLLIKQHYLVMHKKPLVICHKCNRTFKFKVQLKAHLQNNPHESKKYKCLQCPYQTNRKETLTAHSYAHGGTKPYPCETCEKSYADIGSLNQHRFSHLNKKAFPCSECPRGYDCERGLKQHVKNNHGPNVVMQFNCTKCSYKTNYSTCYKSHLLTHPNKFVCKFCEEAFDQELHLKIHACIRSRKKIFSCLVCGEKTKKIEHLERHMKCHDEVKPYECEICMESFGQRAALKIHSRIHKQARVQLQM